MQQQQAGAYCPGGPLEYFCFAYLLTPKYDLLHAACAAPDFDLGSWGGCVTVCVVATT